MPLQNKIQTTVMYLFSLKKINNLLDGFGGKVCIQLMSQKENVCKNTVQESWIVSACTTMTFPTPIIKKVRYFFCYKIA